MGRGEGVEIDAANEITGLRATRDCNAESFNAFGMSREELEAKIGRHPQSRHFKPCLIDTPDGHPIIGLTYKTDYKAEEEWGVSDIRDAITGKDPSRFAQTPESAENISFYSDCDGMILHTFPTSQREVEWESGLNEYGYPNDRPARFYENGVSG